MTSSNANAYKNPFARLTVARDEEERISETKELKDTFDPFNILKGPTKEITQKRKVRPEEKTVSGGNHDFKTKEAEIEDEGFTKVRRGVNPRKPEIDEVKEINIPDTNLKKEHIKGGHKMHLTMPRGGKRLFDRKSGTGRGREISKGGAGGKTTWGNPDVLAKEEGEEYMAQALEDDYNPAEESYFTKALKVEPETRPEDKPSAEESQIKDNIPSITEQAEINLPSYDHIDSKKEEKRKKKHGFHEEKVEPKDLLERPENSISYTEYMDQLKKKNEKLQKDIKKDTMGIEADSIKKGEQPLEANRTTSEDVAYQEYLNQQKLKKKKEKVKEKKVDPAEEDLNRLVGKNLTLQTS